MKTIITSHYLPSIAYFAALASSSEIIIERHEHYTKQTYRNRCHINTCNGQAQLIIPISTNHGKMLITDVRIDNAQKWVNNHWRTIQTAYGRAPFFEYYADDLEKIITKKFSFLYDLNYQLLSMCLTALKWKVPVTESMSYKNIQDDSIKDLRSLINPKKASLLSNLYQAVAYPQVFGNVFVQNLSVIDLIFCEGPEACRIIQASALAK